MSNFSDDIDKLIVKGIESKGTRVMYKEPACELYRSEHSNCIGCEFELGCHKYTAILLVTLTYTHLEPKNIVDYLRQSAEYIKLIDIIALADSKEVINTTIEGIIIKGIIS